MGKRWTPQDNEFLLRHQTVFSDIRHICEHDLGRSFIAGKRQLKFLNESGATRLFATSKLLWLEYRIVISKNRKNKFEQDILFDEMEYWQGVVDRLQPKASLRAIS